MDTRLLEYFLTLCEQEHISSTAAVLGISQPALSKSISKLEAEIGIKLFDRHKNHIRINDYGRIFAERARNILAELRNGIDEIHQSKYDYCGEIRIICRAFVDSINDCIIAYCKLNPRIKINITQSGDSENNFGKQPDFILTTQYDSILSTKGDLVWLPHPLLSESYRILISPRYRKYSGDVTSLSIKELEDDLFVILPEVTVFYTDITYKLSKAAGFSPKIICKTEDFITKMRFVDSGLGICILPECCLRIAEQISPDIQIFNIKDFNTQRTLFLLSQNESMTSECSADFLDYVKEYYRET